MKLQNPNNMKTQIVITGAVLVLFSFSACRPKAYFTKGLKQEIESKNIPIEKVQFYLDREIELKRELSSEAAKVNVGKMEFVNGKYVQVIRFKKYTPGICIKEDSTQMLIAFEKGDEKYVTFKITPVDETIDAFTITGNKLSDSAKTITYDGKTYTIQGEGAQAKLLIKRKVADKMQVKTRKVKGLKVAN